MFFKLNRTLSGKKPASNAIRLIASIALSITLLSSAAWAQKTDPSAPQATAQPISLSDWLVRMHQASMQRRSYVGTMVQSSSSGMSSARIWFACDGVAQVERIESLTGAPRSSIRQNDKLVIFSPDIKLARFETREGMANSGNIADRLSSSSASLADFYTAQALGYERIAGHEAEVVQLNPRDPWRFGYRLWTERKTALVLKIQTLDASGQVLEQAAFSELQLDAPVKARKLKAMMNPNPAEGWRVEHSDAVRTSAAAEGWQLKTAVAGFKPISCLKRGTQTSGTLDDTMQWVFSDGLATVSLFVQPYDKSRHTQEGISSTGATHTLMRRLQDHFLIAVGEVPAQTLLAFAAALERKR